MVIKRGLVVIGVHREQPKTVSQWKINSPSNPAKLIFLPLRPAVLAALMAPGKPAVTPSHPQLNKSGGRFSSHPPHPPTF